jgi:hypothetical protein
MDLVFSFGLMVPFMKEIGNWIEHVVGVSFIMQMGISMMVNGRIIKQMDRVFTYIKMVHFMMGNGKMIYMMVLDKNFVN